MKTIQHRNKRFWDYVTKQVLGGELPAVLSIYEEEQSLYVLSGVSRDYLLNRHQEQVRDLDFVVDTNVSLPDTMLSAYEGCINTFGGAKLRVNGVSVDIWSLENTWGIRNERMTPNVNSLLKSVFFNCTAVVYDVAKRSFFADESFYDFVERGILDIVYDKNPNESLCVVNAFCYQDKYCAKFSPRLTAWLIEADTRIDDYEQTEDQHFHKILFTNKEIRNRINKLKKHRRYSDGLE